MITTAALACEAWALSRGWRSLPARGSAEWWVLWRLWTAGGAPGLDQRLRVPRRVSALAEDRLQARGGVFKHCGCGALHIVDSWRALPLLGLEAGLEWRNCHCGSTLVIER